MIRYETLGLIDDKIKRFVEFRLLCPASNNTKNEVNEGKMSMIKFDEIAFAVQSDSSTYELVTKEEFTKAVKNLFDKHNK
jgi:hypothetical protein